MTLSLNSVQCTRNLTDSKRHRSCNSVYTRALILWTIALFSLANKSWGFEGT